jgi:uncharacterized protein (TIGR02449 family)
MEVNFSEFSKKLDALLKLVDSLKRENEGLKRDLAQARAENQSLSERNQFAATRIETLLDHLPEA